MHSEVKKRADNKDIRWIQYGFADCLDVDPTFEEYKEDFNYCCENVPEMFEKHVELTPRRDNQHSWTDDYWNMLKVDLLENFSRERFDHMRSVAKVVYAEKISRFEQERKQELEVEQRRRASEQKNKPNEEVMRKNQIEQNKNNSDNVSKTQSNRTMESQPNIVKPSKEQELKELYREPEQENKSVEYEKIYRINKVDHTTSVRDITEFELSQNAENEKYLKVKKWRECDSKKLKLREYHYQRIESAEKINKINKNKHGIKNFFKKVNNLCQYKEEEVSWKKEYKVIAYAECDNQTKVPLYYKVIKMNESKLYYELKK
ncbi:MAG: hypothetical protein HFJ07_04865 [Lachnospiraceae bacterium]|nr:hypothetical protein [Lachnospiraceae bacterium]